MTDWDRRQATSAPGLFYSGAMLLQHVQNMVLHCIAEISKAVPEKDVIDLTVCVAAKPVYIVQH